jgi:hypothetical protein
VAKKSKVELEKKIQDFFYCERERLIRMPGYKEAHRRYVKLAKQEGKLEDELLEDMNAEARMKLQKKRQKIQNQINEMLLRYRTRFMPSLNKSDDWKWMRAYSKAVVKKPEKGEWMFVGVSSSKPKIFEVDIWRDKEVIKHELVEWIDKERAMDIGRVAQQESLNKALNANLLKRCFAVFDLRNQKRQLKYQDIVLRLSNFYKGKSLEKMIDSARHDFQKAFEIIYGVPYKRFNKKEVEQSEIKTCDKCRKRKTCIKPCDDVMDLLNKLEVKRQHYISPSRDAAEWGSEDEDIRDALDD